MSAVVRPMHRDRARRLSDIDEYDEREDAIAEALAESEEYGVKKALHRLGPIIADAESAREALAAEVDL